MIFVSMHLDLGFLLYQSVALDEISLPISISRGSVVASPSITRTQLALHESASISMREADQLPTVSVKLSQMSTFHKEVH